MDNQVIFFMGYPGSGKGTQGKIVSKILNMIHLSTGEIFRNEVAKSTSIGKKMNSYMNKGQIIPKEIVFDYLKKELSGSRYRKGIIIDGYPKDIESFIFITQTLKELKYNILCTIYFDVPRNEAFSRLINRKSTRTDDNEDTINKRLNIFEQETIPVSKKISIIKVNASLSVEKLTNCILEYISNVSTVFHNHIDAVNKKTLTNITQKINYNNKISPVSYLSLGSQVKNKEFSDVYSSLPNFHEICSSDNEAFATGKMGDTINYDQIRETLNVCYNFPSNGEIMTEVEEDIYAEKNGRVVLNRGNTPFKIDWNELSGWKEKMIDNVPKFELHHSIDIPKIENEILLPINMEKLRSSLEKDFDIGGLFLFEKKEKWAYRTNEFSNESYFCCITKLKKQSEKLKVLISSFLKNQRKFNTACSLEKVHAIWKIPGVTFVSGNKGKVKDLNSILGYTMKNIDIKEIVEIQDSNVENVAIQKCKDAYKILNTPVLVEDTSFKINCLRGCPGPFVKYFDPDILYQMIQNFDDHSAVGECVFALKKDNEEIVTFKGSVKGKIVSPRGDNGFGWDRIFIPENSDKTYAEMTQEEKNEFSIRKTALKELKNKKFI